MAQCQRHLGHRCHEAVEEVLVHRRDMRSRDGKHPLQLFLFLNTRLSTDSVLAQAGLVSSPRIRRLLEPAGADRPEKAFQFISSSCSDQFTWITTQTNFFLESLAACTPKL